jgi:hypothetical protein
LKQPDWELKNLQGNVGGLDAVWELALMSALWSPFAMLLVDGVWGESESEDELFS